jgi:transcriptional repressor NrdR
MKCPYCGNEHDRVLDSRPLDGASVIRRRRECQACHKRFTTYERLENVPLMVSKSDGRLELFDRTKLREGISRALEKRPLPADSVERLVSEIEYELQDYLMQVPSNVIGEKVLKKLLELDHVAYIRFASVYRQFQDTDAFLHELERLKKLDIKPSPDFHPGRGRKSLKLRKESKENAEEKEEVAG